MQWLIHTAGFRIWFHCTTRYCAKSIHIAPTKFQIPIPNGHCTHSGTQGTSCNGVGCFRILEFVLDYVNKLSETDICTAQQYEPLVNCLTRELPLLHSLLLKSPSWNVNTLKLNHRITTTSESEGGHRFDQCEHTLANPFTSETLLCDSKFPKMCYIKSFESASVTESISAIPVPVTLLNSQSQTNLTYCRCE